MIESTGWTRTKLAERRFTKRLLDVVKGRAKRKSYYRNTAMAFCAPPGGVEG